MIGAKRGFQEDVRRSGQHAAGGLGALARSVGLGLRLSRNIRWNRVFAHLAAGEDAADIVVTANHPGLGAAGGEEGKGQESEEPFHNERSWSLAFEGAGCQNKSTRSVIFKESVWLSLARWRLKVIGAEAGISSQ